MFTAQLICQGACRQVDIVRAFGVSKQSVIRSINKYRAGGVKAFHTPRATRGATVMTPEVTAQAQQLLGAGWSRREVAEHLGLKLDTLRKAFQQGRLTEPGPLEPGATAPDKAAALQPPIATDRSTRAVEDAAAEMGTACTRPDQRVLAAFGLLDGAPTHFEPCRDVSFGGVLCALPALAENGLFRHIHDCLVQLRGYYSTLHVIVLLAHMALCRIKAVEQLQYQPPGELGKLLGLDRVPEVHCLRRKLAALSLDDGPKNGPGSCPETGWRPRRNWPAPCTSTGMFASIMAARPRCPNAMSPGSGCVCGGPPTTGSTTLWASRSLRSNGRSTMGFWRRYAVTSCRVS